ncbi:FliH/SctL family protein [Acetomicrobium hydrogeniformans]|uniref:Flagellar assembly protein FliH n=1 Tax=Acetomicrobium hydrogeniformans TaxID=649746 RepID=A0A7V6ZF76_9BACT|nr:FliH/SctL family protein [Acetomicrobium hydrogeniformans]HHZ04883.1 flagellar assembly protein FliH [Acetomicrobium hydrogeniformans]
MSDDGKLFKTVRLVPNAVKIISKVNIEHLSKSSKETNADDDVIEMGAGESVDFNERKKDYAALKGKYLSIKEKYEKLRQDFEKLKGSLEIEKKNFLEKANKEIEATKERAKKEAYEAGFKQGLEEGKEEALRVAKEEAAQEISGLVGMLEGCYESLSRSMDALLKQNFMKMIRLWEKVLKRLLYKEVKLDNAVLERLLEQVLKRMSDKEKVIIYLHPSEVAYLQERIDQFGDILRGAKHLEFIADDHVDRGSCMVETNLGIYDARWRTQLERLSEEIDRLLMEGQQENGL